MEKKINKFIKKVEIKENCLNELNKFIEEKCVNSGVLFVVDFITYKNYYKKLEEIQKCSLNHIEIFVLKNLCETQFIELQGKINETYDLIVGIGEFFTLKFVETFAIKNNISYAFVNLFLLKSEIFCNINYISNYFPPFFILVEDIKLEKENVFDLYCNIFKYSYLLLESKFETNSEVLSFLNEYSLIINNINEKNIYEKVIALGLILNKYNIKYLTNIKFCEKEINYLIYSNILSLCYKNIFSFMNKNNLYFSRIYKTNSNLKSSYNNFDFDFHKYNLLSIKNNIVIQCNNYEILFKNFFELLKNISIEKCYKISKTLKLNNLYKNFIKNLNDDIFLKRMQYFEIFNLN